jgi:small-conductance mechanosensitive channel
MTELEELAGLVYFGNDLRSWAIALGVFALLFTVLPVVRAGVARRLRNLRPDQSAAALQLLQALLGATRRLFLLAVAAWIALRWLDIPAALGRGIDIALLVIFWLQIALWGTAAVRHLIGVRQGERSAEPEGAASLNILRFIGIAGVWVVAFLMLLANLGVEIMPLIAGLGVGGIAIALAVQNVLGDLLASLSIALDKPFKVGDFLVLGDEKGTVERIGIKSTRLRSLSGEQIIMSNGDLLSSRVRNYGRLVERRVAFAIGIVYETPRNLIEAVPGLIRDAISAQPHTRVDRVHFASFGDFSLNYEAVYYVLSAEYNAYMDIHQAINLKIHEEFERRGIEFAYPTNKQFSVALPPPEN